MVSEFFYRLFKEKESAELNRTMDQQYLIQERKVY